MSFTHTIIHPTDLSEASSHAFELACALARDQGARLLVVYVVPPPTCHAETLVQREPDFEQDLLALVRTLKDPQGRIMIDHQLLYGDPVEEIVRLASESGANLIVMGTHGRTGLRRVLLGSVAEKVLRTASCPVMTVRPDLASRKGEPDTTPSLRP